MFREWCIQQFEERAAAYRAALSELIKTARSYEGVIGNSAISIYQAALREVPVPPMPKYPGTVSEQDRAWYAATLKPDFAHYLNDACTIVARLKTK